MRLSVVSDFWFPVADRSILIKDLTMSITSSTQEPSINGTFCQPPTIKSQDHQCRKLTSSDCNAESCSLLRLKLKCVLLHCYAVPSVALEGHCGEVVKIGRGLAASLGGQLENWKHLIGW